MNVKEWLRQYNSVDIEVESIRAEIHYFNQIQSQVAKERIEELKNKMELLIESKSKLTKIVDSIHDPVARAILRLRYVAGYKWDSVAATVKMSARNAHLIHDNALPEVGKLYDEAMKGAGNETEIIVGCDR